MKSGTFPEYVTAKQPRLAVRSDVRFGSILLQKYFSGEAQKF
jgi:hypothetical protein